MWYAHNWFANHSLPCARLPGQGAVTDCEFAVDTSCATRAFHVLTRSVTLLASCWLLLLMQAPDGRRVMRHLLQQQQHATKHLHAMALL
jgi:hypothetical protein